MNNVIYALKRIQSGELLSSKLVRVLPNNGIIVCTGGYGSGKSVLSYSILEYYHFQNPNTNVYVYGFPEQSAHLLPEWITLWDNLEFPENSIVLIDEAYIQFGSRESQSKKNKFISNFAGLVRQKNILAIFVSQTFHKIEKGLLTATELLLIKKISYLQVELDKSQLRKKLQQVMEEYKNIKRNGYDVRKSVYMISNTECEEGMITNANGVPSFWSEELSNAWMGVRMN